MNSKQLTDEYLKATNKANWVRVTAKKFGVAGSDIICELMKCGYKYAELKRVSESQYNSAVNKYHKWQEDGCPETELVPVEQEEKLEEKPVPKIVPETENETVSELAIQIKDTLTQENEILGQMLIKTREALHEKINVINTARAAESEEVNRVMDQCTIESLSEAVERLEEENESLKGVIEIKDKSIQELLTENANLKNSLHNREDDIFEFKGKLDSTMDLVRTREKRIKELEKELSFYEDEKGGDGAIIEDQNAVIYELREKLKSCEQFILNQTVYNP